MAHKQKTRAPARRQEAAAPDQQSLLSTFTIDLSQHQQAFVDEQDWWELRKYKWHAWWNKDTKSFYARRNLIIDGRKTVEYMHRQIFALRPGDALQVDHLNHDTLDNRRQNLRLVTNRKNHENMRNQSKHGPGIRKDRRECMRTRPFAVGAWVDGRHIHLGYFATARRAARVREEFLLREGRR